jgi:hypothetical protein
MSMWASRNQIHKNEKTWKIYPTTKKKAIILDRRGAFSVPINLLPFVSKNYT